MFPKHPWDREKHVLKSVRGGSRPRTYKLLLYSTEEEDEARMHRPVIGITVSIDEGKRISSDHHYLYIKRAYAQAVAAAGGSP